MAVRTLAHSDKLPPFIGESLATAAPPYDFEGVTLRYFPLKADFHTLANFCDHYLNVVPPEIAYFRPAMPFVMLMIVNYGRMSVDVGNLGWTSQNELLFSVPLEWYRRIDGELVFQDAATIAPYIFVDNEASQSAGREVLGWPKVQGWFAHDLDAWARHPRSRREVLTLKTRVFENLYEDEANVVRELLVVEEEPAVTFTEFPPDPKNPLNPFISLSNSVTAWSNLAGQAFEMMTRMPLRGYADIDRQALLRAPDLSQMQAMGQTMQGNTINLKQMRDAGRPGTACYQAITNAKMEVTQFRRAGMLGDLALLRGNVSGGFRIRMNRYESQPIIDVLGLEVDEERTVGDLRTAYLRPVMPFWHEMDLRYLEAKNICWRTGELDWRDDELELEPESAEEARQPHLYNTTGSAGLQVATGPFRFADATIRVLPFLADPEKLDAVTKACLGEGVRDFEAWGSYVYVLIFSYTDTYSETNDMGNWADKVVEFAIPVRCRDRSTGEHSVGYFSPFLFNNSSIGVTTGREVYGWPVTEAQIESPRSAWLGAGGSFDRAEPYLNVSGEVFPALNVGQKGEWRTIIELQRGLNEAERPDWTTVADGWGRALKRDVSRMASAAKAPSESSGQFLDLQALALELLGNGEGWNHYAFKQFRDGEASDRACYQAIVERSSHIEQLHTLEEIEDPLYLKLHSYPTQPIAETLGLVEHSSYITPTGRVSCFQPSRPFSMHVDMRVDLPVNVCWRSRIDPPNSGPNAFEGWSLPGTSWTSKPAPAYLSRSEPAKVGADLVQYLAGNATKLSPSPFSDMDRQPERLQHNCRVWAEAAADVPELALTRSQAKEAIRSEELEPQMVVHAALSGEWNHAGDSRLRQRQEISERNAAADEELEKPIDRLPTFVIRREAVESEAETLFPEDERVANVGSTVDYWSPTT